jgi:hypothetical protein
VQNPDLIRAAGWRQGSVIVKVNASDQFKLLVDGEAFTHWIVLSQDCDLIHSSYEVEPHVEILGCSVVSKADGNLSHGKNPRRVHFPIKQGGTNLVLQGCIHDRFQIRRDTLEGMKPSATCALMAVDARMIVEWVGRRYTRSAFPDNFNNRIREKGPGIKRVLENHGEVISGIYLWLSSYEEFGEGVPYQVALRLTMTPEEYADESRRDRAIKACNALEIAFQSCAGIKILESDVVPEDKFPLSDLKYLVPWDTFDYLSNIEEA